MKMRWVLRYKESLWQTKCTFGDRWLSRSSLRLRCQNWGTCCISLWKKSVLHGHRSQSVLLGWRSCRHVPCLMTWHVRGRLKGLMCFHVHDVVISGPRDDPEFERMMDKVKRLYEWGEWKQHEFDQCGSRIRQTTDKSVTVDQESYARKISLITMSAHRRKHMSEILSAEEHRTLTAKRGELNWLATQSMMQLLAPLSLIDTSKTATAQSLKDVNRLV